MKRLSLGAAVIALCAAVPAAAVTITFDEFAPSNSNGAIAINQYSGFGVQFIGTDDGSTWGGNANGNPGNWGVDGTNGPIFSGFNGASNAQTLIFSSSINGFSLDASRTNGSVDGTITLQGFLGASLISTANVSLGAINTWSTLGISGTFDRVVYSGTGTGFHPFGIDNLNWNRAVAAVPEPTSWAMLIVGFGLIGATMRRRIVKVAIN